MGRYKQGRLKRGESGGVEAAVVASSLVCGKGPTTLGGVLLRGGGGGVIGMFENFVQKEGSA